MQNGRLTPGTNFWLSIIVFHIIPLMPMIIELILRNSVREETLVITSAIYAAGMTGSSKSIGFIATYVILSLIETTVYGAILFGAKLNFFSYWFTVGSILFVFLTHALDRADLHLAKRQQFWSNEQWK
jgi:hypothetical protein